MRAPSYQPQTNAPSGSQVRLVAADNGGGVAGGIARGLQSAARGVGQYADAELQIQERHNDTHARKLALDWQREAQPLLSEYSTLQGEDAIKRAGPLREQIAKLREDYAAKAGNERMRNLFETRTEEDLVRYEGNIIDYSTKAAFKMDLDVTKSEIENETLTAITNWSDPMAHAASLAKVEQGARREADLLGLTGASVDAAVRDRVSAAVFDTMTAMASDPAFLEGDMMAYYDAMEDQMTVDHRNKALAALQVPIRNRWADGEFASIVSGTPVADADAGGGVSSSAPTGTAPRQRPVDAALGQDFAKHRARGSAGADYPAPAGTSIKPVAEGQVVEAGYGKTGGNYVRIKHADGSMTSYMHMGSPSPLKAGDRVTRSTVIGSVGSTGRSTGPHLHLEVKDASGRQIDPEEYLKGSVPLGSPDEPRQWDRASIFGEIDRREAEGQYSPEEAEFIRDRADKRISRDEQAMDAIAADAKERAQAWLVDNIENFTDISQMPADIRDDLNPASTLQFMGIAGRMKSSKEKATAAESGSALSYLNGIKTLQPDAFIDADLTEYAPLLTQKQFASFVTAQATMKQKREQGVLDYAPATTIRETISRMSALDGTPIKGDDLGAAAALMEERANLFVTQNNGKLPGKADYEDFYRYATAKVEAKRDYGLFETRSTMPRYQIDKSVERAQGNVAREREERAAARQRNRDIDGFRSAFFKKNGRFPNALELDAGLANLEQ